MVVITSLHGTLRVTLTAGTLPTNNVAVIGHSLHSAVSYLYKYFLLNKSAQLREETTAL